MITADKGWVRPHRLSGVIIMLIFLVMVHFNPRLVIERRVGFPLANPHEARKLGLLHKQKFPSRVGAT